MRKWYFARKQNRGFLLDGFPRNLLQAEALDEWLETRRDTLGACLYLKIGRDEAIVRISQRRVCPKDGSVYHLAFHPPKVAGICDLCGGPLIQRSDDTEETVVRRWRLFEEHTYPLVSYYRSRGLLLQFDASRPADEVSGDVVKTLSSCSLA